MHMCRQQGPNFRRTFERCPKERGEECEFFMWLTPSLPAAGAASGLYKSTGRSSSSVGTTLEGRDGMVYEQAVPEECHGNREKERLRR